MSSLTNATYLLSILLLVRLSAKIMAFPDGAPSDTCVKKRPNQPNHGQARSQPSESNPYDVVADSESYHPGQEVSGTLKISHCKFYYMIHPSHALQWSYIHTTNRNCSVDFLYKREIPTLTNGLENGYIVKIPTSYRNVLQ